MRSYELTTEAKQDLDRIADYIATEASAERAVQVIENFTAAFRRLGEMPGSGHVREELLDSKHRFWSVYSYLMVYRADLRPIRIVCIVHGARDLPAYFEDKDF
jgi:toxin ParE1/3/4